jgi:hypothetical protein
MRHSRETYLSPADMDDVNSSVEVIYAAKSEATDDAATCQPTAFITSLRDISASAAASVKISVGNTTCKLLSRLDTFDEKKDSRTVSLDRTAKSGDSSIREKLNR